MASNEGRGNFCTAITSFISWLVCLLASLFKRSGPLEELPIVMSGSQQTMALLQTFDAENQVPARPRPHVRQHGRAGPDLGPPVEERLFRPPISPIKPTSCSSIPVAREKPLSNYPTTFRWTAPATRLEDDDWDSVGNASPLSDGEKVHSDIGNLGQRRGFKGKPLTVGKWSRSSSFLSLPKGLNFRPRSLSMISLDGTSSSSPRTSLGAMANRMRSVSVSVVSWSSGVKSPVPEISRDLQDLYDTSDPFASHGDTFFACVTGVPAVPTSDLCQLGFYKQNGKMQKHSRLVKKNAPLEVVLHPAFTNARMKTTIYDLSTTDVVPPRVTVSCNAGPDTLVVPEKSPDVVDGIIAVKSPTIILTAPPSPTIQEAEPEIELPVSEDTSDKSQQIVIPPELEPGSNKVPRSAFGEIRNSIPPTEQDQHELDVLVTHSTPVDRLDDDGHANTQLPTFPYAEFPKVVYETCTHPCDDQVTVPFPGIADDRPLCLPQRPSPLRPLVLPVRVASRMASVVEDDMGHSHALEGIIALLDVAQDIYK